MSSIICQRCREINEPNANICQKCGARFCPSCHLVIESPNASVCPHCGKKDITFRPGKYGVASYSSADQSVAYAPGKNICQSCGSKIDSGVKKCPYCGQLGSRLTMTPMQGHGVLHPAHGESTYGYTQPAESEQGPSLQRVCPKCGMPFPPGSSQCPKHGKYGGTGILSESSANLPGRHTGDLWRKIEEKRAASASAEQMGVVPHHTTPRDIYPQMMDGPQAPHETYAQGEQIAQRICPSCGSAVPDRSKVCPVCGWNRLPPQKSRPPVKAEEFYKAQLAVAQPYPAYTPQVDPYYSQQGGAQPYEMMYPAQPAPLEMPYAGKKRRKEKPPKEKEFERWETHPRPANKSILPMLLALLAIIVVIGFAASYILGEINKPAVVIAPPATTGGSTAPKAPVINNIEFKDIGKDSATIVWKTDKKSNSKVTYCIDEAGGQCRYADDPAMGTDHNVKLTGLESSKSYHITVTSRLDDNPATPYATKEVEQVLRLQGVVDTTPPKISDVKPVNVTGSAATISWKTDEPSTSQVHYGTTATYGTIQPNPSDSTLTLVHDVMLQGLAPNSTFHFKVLSKDAAGNESSSSDATFTTAAPAGSAIGNQAPEFTLNSNDGSSVSLSSFRGKKVIINFWHTKCPYCVKEMPDFQTIHTNNPDVAMLAIDTPAGFGPDDPVHVGDFINKNAYTFTVLLDTSGRVALAYNVTAGIPVTFFLDSQGIIRKMQDGSFTNASAIQGLLSSY